MCEMRACRSSPLIVSSLSLKQLEVRSITEYRWGGGKILKVREERRLCEIIIRKTVEEMNLENVQ